MADGAGVPCVRRLVVCLFVCLSLLSRPEFLSYRVGIHNLGPTLCHLKTVFWVFGWVHFLGYFLWESGVKNDTFFWRPKSCKQAPRRSFYPMWDIKPILDLSWRYLKKDFRIFRNFYFLSTSFSKKCLNCHILHICNIRKGAPGCSFFPMVDIKPIIYLHWCYLKWKFRIHWNFYFISTKNPRWPTWS